MNLFKFLFASHWRIKGRWLMLVLLMVVTAGIWASFNQLATGAQADQVTMSKQNKVLLGPPTTKATLAKVGLAQLPPWLSRNGAKAAVMREELLTAAAIKGDFGTPFNNAGLPVTNQYGANSLSTILQVRRRVAKRLIQQHQSLSSMRYGTKDWPFMISLLPLMTSIFGIMLMTVIVMWPELMMLTSRRRHWLTTLPGSKPRMILIQLSVFIADLLIFISTIMLTAFVVSGVGGGRTSMMYPVVVRTGGAIRLLPAVQVVALAVGLFILACTLMYLVIRLMFALIYGIHHQGLKLLTSICAYWLLLGQLTLSLLPQLLPSTVVQWLPGTYMQASRILFGTDYLGAVSTVLWSLNYYDGSHLMLSLDVQNMSYYSGATLANLFGNGHDLLLRGVLLLGGSIFAVLALIMGLTRHRNRLV